MIVAQLSYWSVSYRQLATGSLFAYIVHRRNPQHVMSSVTWFLCDLSNCVSVLWTIVAFLLFFFFFFFSYHIFSYRSTVLQKELQAVREKIESSIVALPNSRVRAIFLWYLLWLVISYRCSSSVTTRGRFISKEGPPLRLAGEKRFSWKSFSLYISRLFSTERA